MYKIVDNILYLIIKLFFFIYCFIYFLFLCVLSLLFILADHFFLVFIDRRFKCFNGVRFFFRSQLINFVDIFPLVEPKTVSASVMPRLNHEYIINVIELFCSPQSFHRIINGSITISVAKYSRWAGYTNRLGGCLLKITETGGWKLFYTKVRADAHIVVRHTLFQKLSSRGKWEL